MEADSVALRRSKPSVASDYLSAVDRDIRFAHALEREKRLLGTSLLL
jgi:hypothetical protein